MAMAMVPVDVQKAQVAIDRDRVETVVKPELEAREHHGKVAQDFELAKLKITAEKEVRIAVAEASATLFQKVEATLYGTPDDVTKMLDSVIRGQSVANTIDGFFEAADEQTKNLVAGVGGGLTQLASAAADRLRSGKSDSGANGAGANGKVSEALPKGIGTADPVA